MMLLRLFWSFIQVGLFSVGGGYAAMPLIQAQVIDANPWLTLAEFTNLITIAEMTPGPIAINAATFVGMRIAGVLGAIVATVGCILPSVVIVAVLARVYYRYQKLSLLQSVLGSLRPAVVALIAGAGLTIILLVLWNGCAPSLGATNWVGAASIAGAFVLIRKCKWNPIFVMGLCGAAALIVALITGQLG